jgi:hypothetical protein
MNYMDAVLYVHNIFTEAAQVLTRYFPHLTWTVCECFGGFDDGLHINLKRIPMMANNDVGGSSTKNMMHWAQMVRSGKLAQFDYGAQGNMQAYGSLLPLEYPVDTLASRLESVPILLFSG